MCQSTWTWGAFWFTIYANSWSVCWSAWSGNSFTSNATSSYWDAWPISPLGEKSISSGKSQDCRKNGSSEPTHGRKRISSTKANHHAY
jgi:hypothetical protein